MLYYSSCWNVIVIVYLLKFSYSEQIGTGVSKWSEGPHIRQVRRVVWFVFGKNFCEMVHEKGHLRARWFVALQILQATGVGQLLAKWLVFSQLNHYRMTSVGKVWGWVTKAACFRLSNIVELNKVLAESRVAGNRLFHSDLIMVAAILNIFQSRITKKSFTIIC